MAKAEILTPFILSWEGGFANIPDDRGGATNKGVTLATFRSVFGSGRTVADLKRMTDDQWEFIFRKYFWNRWKADQIQSQPIANLLVDWMWTSGSYGVKLPQKVLQVKIDGIVGPKTLAAVNDHPDQRQLFHDLWVEREAFFRRIGVKEQRKFLNGWLNRLSGIRYECLVCNGGKTIML
ncbi:glycoside hydrolase family 108 protein [Prevotella sp. tf2-5]|uniref:glycoside hydrolase family 108 protein n=1 Tax=Prevotella sp. tf2-5 TaxID=1761889 RepID=UPI0008F3B2C5|nr:glycosyl hydrolase 108 family protein [Prevotella sp. tf2-5]SFO62074.1 Predicted Peptidoglycan domain-containing protein [Prevotella sp. tf2-5]